MEYLIAIIVGIGIIWTVYAISNKAPHKRKKRKEEASELIVNIRSDKDKEKVVGKERKVQKTLDSIYAQSNNLWICNYCETINSNEAKKCVACGRAKA